MVSEFFMTCHIVPDLLFDRLSVYLFAAVGPQNVICGYNPQIFLLTLLAVIFVPITLKIMALRSFRKLREMFALKLSGKVREFYNVREPCSKFRQVQKSLRNNKVQKFKRLSFTVGQNCENYRWRTTRRYQH